MDYKEIRKTLLLLEHNDITHNEMLMSGNHTLLYQDMATFFNGHVFINTYLTLSLHRINILTLGTVCINKHSCRSLTLTIKHTVMSYKQGIITQEPYFTIS